MLSSSLSSSSRELDILPFKIPVPRPALGVKKEDIVACCAGRFSKWKLVLPDDDDDGLVVSTRLRLLARRLGEGGGEGDRDDGGEDDFTECEPSSLDPFPGVSNLTVDSGFCLTGMMTASMRPRFRLEGVVVVASCTICSVSCSSFSPSSSSSSSSVSSSFSRPSFTRSSFLVSVRCEPLKASDDDESESVV